MDAFKPGPYVVGAGFRSNKTNQTILTAIAGFHGHLAGTRGPAFHRPELRLLRAVDGNIWVPTRARLMADAGMPEANWTRRIGILVELKLGRVQGISGGVAVLPHPVGIFLKREIAGQVKDFCWRCEKAKQYDDCGDSPHTQVLSSIVSECGDWSPLPLAAIFRSVP